MTHTERFFRQRHGYGCEPTTLLMLGSLAISAVGTASSIQGQKYAAEAQEEQQANLTKANNAVAEEQAAQLRLQEAQANEAAARENNRAALATQRTTATSVVAAGEAGASGASVDALLREHAANLGQFRDVTNRQSRLNALGTNAQIEAIRTGSRFQNLSINAPIVGPNYTAEFARFGGSALGTVKDYNPSAFQKKK